MSDPNDYWSLFAEPIRVHQQPIAREVVKGEIWPLYLYVPDEAFANGPP